MKILTPFFHWNLILRYSKHTLSIVKRLQNAFFMSFTLLLYRYPTVLWQGSSNGLSKIRYIIIGQKHTKKSRKADRKVGWGEVEGGSTLIVSLTVKYPGEDEEKKTWQYPASPWKPTRNHEIPLKTLLNTEQNHEHQPKIVKKPWHRKHRQQWLSPNKRISSDGNVCPKTSLRKKDHCHCIYTNLTSIQSYRQFWTEILDYRLWAWLFCITMFRAEASFSKGYVLP